MRLIFRFLYVVIAKLIGGIIYLTGTVTLGVVLAVGALVYFMQNYHLDFGALTQQDPPASQYLLQLDGFFRDDVSRGFVREFVLSDEMPRTMFELERAINHAKDDDKVLGLVMDFSGLKLSPYQSERLHKVVLDFRNTGKYTIAHYAGSGGNNFIETAALSAFAVRIIDPVSHYMLGGVAIERPYLKVLLDEIGIKWDIIQRYEYKTTYASLVNDGPSDEEIKSDNHFLDDVHMSIVRAIASGTALEREEILQQIEGGVINAQIASEQSGLFTHAFSSVDMPSFLDDHVGHSGYGLRDVYDYARELTQSAPQVGALQVFVLHLDGIIDGGQFDDGVNAHFVQDSIDNMAELAELGLVDALILVIDSPGGDFNASDEIYRILANFKQQWPDILLIAQFMNVAASGGYYIGLPADHIIAGDLSVTGSIGVLVGKLVLGEAAEKYGITVATTKRGINADMWSPIQVFSDAQRIQIENMADDVYMRFAGLVAEERELKRPIDQVARGRVALGVSAQKMGLVDTLGGYGEAMAAVYDMTGSDVDRPVSVNYYQDDEALWERAFTGLANILAKPSLSSVLHSIMQKADFANIPFWQSPAGLRIQLLPMRIVG
ncbi:MAG: S49 family peptidase [Pseudomonadota bacterium]